MATNIALKIKKESPKAILPEYAHDGDAAMDITVTSVEYDASNDCYIYDTGLAFETDCTAALKCYPRSHIYKFNYFLTNGVGIVDTKTYRGTVKAIFKHRDSIQLRLHHLAMLEYDALPFWKKLMPGTYKAIFDKIYKSFLADPIPSAPYQPGDRAFQIIVSRVTPVNIKQVKKLSPTQRGTSGHGGSGIHGKARKPKLQLIKS